MATRPLLRPAALEPGDRIALVATSWGAVHHLPERSERAINALRDLGYEPVLMPNAGFGGDGIRDWVSATAEDRLDDLHAAFADPSIVAVLSVIGGDHCAQMLDGLDLDLIASNPKIFCGYSDTTGLLHAIHDRTGLVTFYGPALVPEFGEPEGPDREVVDHWLSVIGSPTAPGALPIVPWQSAESRIDSDAGHRNMRRGEPEPRVTLRPGTASGPLLAACLPRSAGPRTGVPRWRTLCISSSSTPPRARDSRSWPGSRCPTRLPCSPSPTAFLRRSRDSISRSTNPP